VAAQGKANRLWFGDNLEILQSSIVQAQKAQMGIFLMRGEPTAGIRDAASS